MNKITEEFLKELGFKRCTEDDAEQPFYYYSWDWLGIIDLITYANDEVEEHFDGNWIVMELDGKFEIADPQTLEVFIRFFDQLFVNIEEEQEEEV